MFLHDVILQFFTVYSYNLCVLLIDISKLYISYIRLRFFYETWHIFIFNNYIQFASCFRQSFLILCDRIKEKNKDGKSNEVICG